MMTTNTNSVDKHKHSVISDSTTLNLYEKSSYVTRCQVCGWYGYPEDKIIVEFEGMRPEYEDGFVYKFTEYDYDGLIGQNRIKHVHKYKPELVQELRLDL
jgi:hypothetical protein